eukprot:Hpha_TRINITY_DN15236_c4_g3::TRINITY_DN15236_c4_g3_i1::g.65451::m.65451
MERIRGWGAGMDCGKCSAWMMRDSDTPHDVFIKRRVTPVAIALTLFVCLTIFNELRTRANTVLFVSQSFYLLAFAQFFVFGYFGSDMRKAIDLGLLCGLVAITLNDMVVASYLATRAWGFIVIILDLGLLFDATRTVPLIIFVVLFYLLVDSTEAAVRFGLYDVISSEAPPVCDCADPPCSKGIIASFTNYIMVAAVLLVDFSLTRGFATDLRHQLRRVRASVEVAGEIAAALGRYDVDVAEEAIERGKDLPEELSDSFRPLLSNLRLYKAYLPHSCLVQNASSALAPGEEQPSESGSEHREALLFTKNNSQDSLFPDDNASSASSIRGNGIETRELKAAPRRGRVSLAAGNRIGYLSSVSDQFGELNADWIATDVEHWCMAVVDLKGVVDLMGGDRRYASFNARQGCYNHAAAAVGALSCRADQQQHEAFANDALWSGCVVTGQAVCGDFGSTSVLRFMVLGALSSSLHPLERTAARWQIKVLADGEAFSCACFTWEGELLGSVFLRKRGQKPVNLYAMGSRKSTEGTNVEEWMYVLDKMEKGTYDEANEAKTKQIKEALERMPVQVGRESVLDQGVLWRIEEVGLEPY